MSASVIGLTGPLEREALVVRQRELRADLDVHLEVHRAVVGQLDGRDVELGLGDRVELVVLVELLQRRHQQRRLDLVGDLLAEPLDRPAGGAPARAGSPARRPPCRSPRATPVYCRSISLRGIETLTCFLHGPTSRDLDAASPACASARLGGRLVSRPRRRCRPRVPAPRCSSKASSRRDIRLGWLGPPPRNRRARAKAANPGWHRSKSGRRDLNPRHPRWQRGALPLSYSRIVRQDLMLRPATRRIVPAAGPRPGPISSIARSTPDCKPSSGKTPGAAIRQRQRRPPRR